MSNVINMTVPGNPDYIKVCRNTAMAAASVMKLDVDAVDEIGMAVYEACKAITCHGHDCWAKTYTINIEMLDENLTITVQATGQHDVEKCKKICLDCPKEGDLGIAIIKSIMDKVEIEKEGNNSKKITMVKNYAKQNII